MTLPAHLTPGRNTQLSILGLLSAAMLGYLLFSLWSGWREVLGAMQRLSVGAVVALLALSLLNYGLRFVRWRAYLGRMGHNLPWADGGLIYIGGFGLTTTPGKMGEAIRCLFLRPFGVPYAHSMAAFLSERLADLLGMSTLAALGIWAFPAFRPLMLAAGLMIAALLLLFTQGHGLLNWLDGLLRHRSRWAPLLHASRSSLEATRLCYQPSVVAWVLPMTLLAWAAEAWATHLLLGWLGIHSDWQFSFFVYAISMMAGAFSLIPGGLGSTETVMLGLLLWRGADQPSAVAATVIIRLATLWFAVLLGQVALLHLLRHPPQPAGSKAVGR